MIVTKKSSVIFFTVISSLLFFALSFKSYSIISSISDLSDHEIKAVSEKIFLFGLLGSFFIFASGLRIIFKSLFFERSLDKLLMMSRAHGYTAETGLKKLGKLGKKLSEIYFEVNSLSDRKSKKIFSLNRLVNLLVSFSDRKIIIISLTGEILFYTESVRKKHDENLSLTGTMISDVISGFNLASVIDDISKSRKFEYIEPLKTQVYPVFNSSNDIDFLVLVLDEQTQFSIIPATRDMIQNIRSRNKKSVQKFSIKNFSKKMFGKGE